MIRRLAIASITALALGSCASYDSSYRHGYADGIDRGSYNDGYYAAVENGYGDYYYDRSQIVWNAYGGYGYRCPGFGYGFGYFPGSYGYGFGSRYDCDPWNYSPWYGYGYPWGWYRPWPRHHHHNDNDHDADDPPGGWSGGNRIGGVRMQAVTAPTDRSKVRRNNPVQSSGQSFRYQRDPIRRSPSVDAPPMHDGDTFHGEQREPSGNRAHPRDATHR